MPLVSLRDVTLSFRGPPLLDGVNLQFEHGEKICLLGRNGAGKSTLMKLIAGDIEPDNGQIVRQQGVRVARLTQEVPQDIHGSVYDEVARGLGRQAELLAEYHALSVAAVDKAGLAQLERLGRQIEAAGGWDGHLQVERVLTQMGLDPDANVALLSAGQKRRVLLAKALACDPHVLLLDEPTNHLDIDAITWLEEFLLKHDGTLLFVTHDRMFLRKLATRIVEVDRGQLSDWTCDYETFLKRKQAQLDSEEAQWALFDKRLAQEEVWIRTGIRARRTRNEGRVRALEKMRDVRSQRRERIGTAKMQIQDAERTGRLVIEAKNVTYGYGQRPVIRDVTTTLLRGDKVGVIGPNGSGKTTLLQLLLGQLTPQTGTVRHGTHLEVAYFDQLHAQLNDEQSVQDNVADGNDRVTINGQSRHMIGYLQDFLFSPDRARSPVKQLSGGERNRLLLARLFAKPSNVLVLDEPTNDLDAETLELLEELLGDYSGTVLLVSHDREFLNNVVSSTLVLEGGGQVKEYAGGYDDWLRQRKSAVVDVRGTPTAPTSGNAAKSEDSASPASVPRPRRLNYNEKRELQELPARIERLESEQRQLHEAMAQPSFYQQSGSEIAKAKTRLDSLEQELSTAYQRWESLDALAP